MTGRVIDVTGKVIDVTGSSDFAPTVYGWVNVNEQVNESESVKE